MINIITATHRPGSHSGTLARIIADQLATMKAPSNVHDLALLPDVAFSPRAMSKRPPCLDGLDQALRTASGIVVTTPEYNGIEPGALKLILDVVGIDVIANKVVWIVGVAAGRFGAVRAVDRLATLFTLNGAAVYPKSVLIPFCESALDPTCLRVLDEEIELRLKDAASGFLDAVPAYADRERLVGT